jgi:hypothetical protein
MLFDIQGCDPLDIKLGQACLVWVRMTASINDFLIVCHQREAANVLQHAEEGVVDHDGIVVEVSRVLEDLLVLVFTWQVLTGFRKIFLS